jgi:hypothetical protein
MITVIETRRAEPGEGDCAACLRPLSAGQRIVLVRRGTEHQWVHVRHVAEHQADNTGTEPLTDGGAPADSSTPAAPGGRTNPREGGSP